MLRIGELLALRWSDIIEKDGKNFIYVHSQKLTNYTVNDDMSISPRDYKTVNHTKNRKDEGFRFQPLSDKANEVLAKAKMLNPSGEFIFMIDGKQLSCPTFNEHLKRCCIALNIPYYSSHIIRFTAASILCATGVPLNYIQRLLGHTTLAMTIHYLRSVSDEDSMADIMCNALN